jgi:hypothetical protein
MFFAGITAGAGAIPLIAEDISGKIVMVFSGYFD